MKTTTPTINPMTRTIRNAASIAALAVAGTLTAAAPALADEYPSKPIRIITPYNPGSMVDATTRLIADELRQKYGQPVVVENRAGGFGMIASTTVLNAPADGYTLLTDTPASAINPTLHKAKYNAKTDLTPIAQFMKLPFVVAVNPSLGAKTAAELVEKSKKIDGGANTAVAGTSTGLVGELFGIQTGAKFLSVPYKGAGAATLSVLQDETQVIFLDAANLAQHINAGKLHGLLITSDERSPVLKDVPTAREAGFPQFDVSTWFGLFAKAGVPQEVQDKLNAAVREVMASPKMQEYLAARGATSSSMTTAEFKTFFNGEVDRWAEVIEKAGIKIE